MIGQTISHYRIVSQLGVGGMGVVYAADDPRLNRQVALKFVPDDLAHDAHALERLRSEARTASALNHANICTIYDIGEYNHRPFIVMELLKGITLRDRLAARPLKIHEAIDIGIQVADALFWAHSKDVIHRDIKPANLFLVDQGQIKVLDFGLAKFVVAQAATGATLAPTIDLTAVGVALGTVAYMSPEQVAGDTLDRRTDLFSLGVVLYECVTGQQPFKGKTSAVVLASILTQTPAAPAALNSDVPPRLQEIINNCLEKDRELRYQDAAGLRADLKRIKRDLESGALKAATGQSTGSVTVSIAPDSRAVALETAGTEAIPVAPARRSRRTLFIGAGVAGAALLGMAVALSLTGRQSAPAPAAVAAPPMVTPSLPPATPPSPADQARARFDEAIVEANRRLAAGDTDGATRALSVARAIDPGAPAVTELSARLVQQFRSATDGRRASSDPPVPPAERRSPSETALPGVRQQRGPSSSPGTAAPQRAAPSSPAAAAQPKPDASDRVETPPVNTPAPSPGPVPSPPRVAAVEPPPAPPPAAARPDLSVERRSANPPAAAVEDDDAAIRRVVATYVRAIEGKDLALFRSVKPNMSADEQRRVSEGFRAVTSQRVDVTIVGIEHKGQEASVHLRRRDVIQARGRQQTADSQQAMTLVKTAAGWVIREIGR
jgi:hypothetical protein